MGVRQSAVRRGLTLGAVTLVVSAGLVVGVRALTPPAGPGSGGAATPAGSAELMAGVRGMPPSAAPDPDGAAVPVLDWVPCPLDHGPPGTQCATARVPLSYRDPHGPLISLALTKRLATDPQHKIGTVFTNPGGPGGGGRIPPRLSPAVSARFDIVGFDPRGTMDSSPVTCSDDPADDAKLHPFPITEAEETAAIQKVGEITARCAQHAGPLLAHMSTANVARDMDLLRRAVGDQQLNYVGTSYGTVLGEVYANLFPQRVRTLLLDAVFDPEEWTTGRQPGESAEPWPYRVGAYLGAQTALETLLRNCAADTRCEFGEPGATEQTLHRKYDDLLAALRRGPITLTNSHGEKSQVTYQGLVEEMLSGLYSRNPSPLTGRLQRIYLAAQHPVAATGATPTVAAAGKTDDGAGEVQRPSNTWFNAVTCTDTDNPRDPRAIGRYARLAEPGAPGFASLRMYQALPCATWPVTDPDRYTGPWNRPTANPVLLVGNRLGDPATPYEGAVATSHLLGSARLLTVDVPGHGIAYDGENRCVDSWADKYLIERTLPPESTVCPADHGSSDPQ